MKVRYGYSEEGITCDRCGTYIKNVYTIEDGEMKVHVGSECVNKITNLTEYGLKILRKYRSNVKSYEAKLADFLTRDYDMISKKYYHGSYGAIQQWNEYKARTFEQFKEEVEAWIRIIPRRIEGETERINSNFKTAKIKI